MKCERRNFLCYSLNVHVTISTIFFFCICCILYMKFYTRKSPRHPTYDYTLPWSYFVTICTKDREHYFGEIERGKMILNELGKYGNHCIQWLPKHRKTVHIDTYVVMPNHVHMIITMVPFTNDMNVPITDTRKDALLGRPDDNDISRPDDNDIWHPVDIWHPDDNNIWLPVDNDIWLPVDNVLGHAKSVSLPSPTYNPNYTWPTLWSIINMLKWSVTKYAKKNNIPFARQSRYYDIIIKDERAYQNIKHYIINNSKNRKEDRFH